MGSTDELEQSVLALYVSPVSSDVDCSDVHPFNRTAVKVHYAVTLYTVPGTESGTGSAGHRNRIDTI